MKHEAYGYEPQRFASCPCGWGQRFPNLSAANVGAAQHLDEGCEGCDHAIHMEDLHS